MTALTTDALARLAVGDATVGDAGTVDGVDGVDVIRTYLSACTDRLDFAGDQERALAVGTRAGALVARACSTAESRAWDAIAVGIAVGGAAAGAALLGLDVEEARRALGIAASQASGLDAVADTPLGEYQRAHAAAVGYQAARLAAAGLTAPSTGIEGRRGLLAVLVGESDGATRTAPGRRGSGCAVTAAPVVGLTERLAPTRSALLVIDMANDFVHPDGKAARVGGRDVSHAHRIIPAVRALVDAARTAGVLVVHCQHTTLAGGASSTPAWLDARSRAAFSALDICLDGTWGHDIIDELRPADGDVVVRKHRYGGFTGTNLELILRSLGRDRVVCCGVSSNVCVDTTAREAFHRDLFVTIVEDACASWDMALHAATLATAANRFAVVASTASIVECWASTRDTEGPE